MFLEGIKMLNKNVDLEGKHILITGAVGFIGSNLVLELLRTLSSVNILGIDSVNDYYDVKIKEWRLQEIEKEAKNHTNSKWNFIKGNNHAQAEQLQAALRQQMQENREELNRSIRELRMEMTQTLNQKMQQLQDVLHKNMMTNGELQRQKFDTMARQQEVLIKSTEKRLDDMRLMVEESAEEGYSCACW